MTITAERARVSQIRTRATCPDRVPFCLNHEQSLIGDDWDEIHHNGDDTVVNNVGVVASRDDERGPAGLKVVGTPYVYLFGITPAQEFGVNLTPEEAVEIGWALIAAGVSAKTRGEAR